MTSPPRKGSQRIKDIPPAVLKQLNRGEIETASLAEALAVDLAKLLVVAAPELERSAVRQVAKLDGFMKKTAAAGQLLAEQFGAAGVPRFAQHPSDTVRGWTAFMIGALPDLTLDQRLASIRLLADDRHFGVREAAWLGLRPHVAANLEQTLRTLKPWTKEKSENLRRFAVESTRPRGVWCSHLPRLKEQPELGLPLLDPLSADPARYVQNSVANWLNDAAKSQPQWVELVCRRWEQKPSPATLYICKRARRSLG